MKIRSRNIALSLVAVSLLGAAALAETGSFDRTLKVTGNVDLSVLTGSGDVVVRSAETSDVHIVGKIKTNDSWFGGDNGAEKIKRLEAAPPIEQSGNTIRVGDIKDEDLRRNVSISYEIDVPRETKLTAHTGSGDLQVNGLLGPVDVKSGSGNATLNNISQDVTVEVGSGTIEAKDINGDLRAGSGSGNINASGNLKNVNVRSGSGSLAVKDVHGSLTAHTGSGDIEAWGTPSSSWDFQTGSGDVKMHLPEKSNFELDAQTGSGSVHLTRPLTVQGELQPHHVHGVSGSGGAMVRVRTGSGDVAVD